MSKSIRRIKDPSTYIKEFYGYSNEKYRDAITVEHRSNNPKRDYLFVNKLQCKHIPSSPTRMLKMCDNLAEEVLAGYDGNVLVIGFAETATAIGSLVAERIPTSGNTIYVTHTTREEIKDSTQLLKFEEEHSHATTQKLLVDDRLKTKDLSNFDSILFVEDEISTGNTILNFVKAFNKQYNIKLDFYVASVCNWQSDENKRKFFEAGIGTHALIRGELKDVNAKMFTDEEVALEDDTEPSINWRKALTYDLTTDSKDNKDNIFRSERLGHGRKTTVPHLDEILKMCDGAETIRVIGTEEFMTIPIKIGAALEKQGKTVLCHSTTRSKIDVIKDSLIDGCASGIKSRHRVKSFYEDERETYIYNLEEKVDLTLVISDTPDAKQFNTGVESLARAIGYNTNAIIGVRL